MMRRQTPWASALGALLLVLASAGCGSAQYLTPTSLVRPDSLFQITDADIREAYNTEPQLPRPLNVAVYHAGTVPEGFSDSLRAMPEVAHVFEISPALVEGDRYHAQRGWYGFYRDPPAPDLKRLRLWAARGRADVLVFTAVSHIYKQDANFLASTYALLLPALFVPGLDARLTTGTDVFFLDVRNGFLYGAYSDEATLRERFVTLYYRDSLEDEKQMLTQRLVPGMAQAARDVFANDAFYVQPHASGAATDE